MSPSLAQCTGFCAVAALLVPLPALAKVDLAATVTVPAAAPAKSCSGAFRYAARVGNTDIVEVSPVQAFARERRLSRIRYTRGSSSDADTAYLLLAMCGAR